MKALRLSLWASALLSLCLPLRADEPPVEPDPAAEPQHLSDLRTWRESGLPVASWWNAGGYTFDRHVAEIQAGHRLLPELKIPLTDKLDNPRQLEIIAGLHAPLKWLSDNRLPLSLRDQSQLAVRFAAIRPSAADLAGEGWRQTAAGQVRALSDGKLDSRPVVDPFAPVALYRAEGTRIGKSPWLKRLQVLAPNVSAIEYSDNNEASRDAPSMYLRKNRDTGEWTWKTDTIRGVSIRAAEHGAALNWQAGTETAVVTLPALAEAQYLEFFSGLAAEFVQWRGKPVRSNAYSAQWEYSTYDTFGPAIYPGSYSTADLTSPTHVAEIRAWEQAWTHQRQRRGQSFAREIFVRASPNSVAWKPLADGFPLVTPATWQAFCELLLWSAHDRQPGAPAPCGVKLHDWTENETTLDTPLFGEDGRATLEAIGRADMAPLTYGDYSRRVVGAVDRVLDTGLLRDFWVRGTEAEFRVVSPAGTQGQALRDGGSYLVYLFDPREPTGERVEVVLDGVARSLAPLTRAGSYRLLAPPEEVDLVETVIE